MIISKGEPWILWPEKYSHGLCKNDLNKSLQGNNDFTIGIDFKLLTKGPDKRTIFSRLPNYLGLDIEKENNNVLFICKTKKGEEEKAYYEFSDFSLDDSFYRFYIRYNKKNNFLDVSIDGKVIIEVNFDKNEELLQSKDSHIIFGSGNFPHNGFNLNYSELDIKQFFVSEKFLDLKKFDTKELLDLSCVGIYDFENKTDYQIWDYTENYNLIGKIL